MNYENKLIIDKLKYEVNKFSVKYDKEKGRVCFGMLINLSDVSELIYELNHRYNIDMKYDFIFATNDYNDWTDNYEVYASYDINIFKHILDSNKDCDDEFVQEQQNWFGSD